MASFTRSDEQAWRALASAAADPDVSAETLLMRVRATAGRVMPCERRRDQAAFVALQALARAAGEGTRARRARLSDCLADLAADCAEVAGWSLRTGTLSVVPGELAPSSLDLFAA